jgi:hypothetical protein
MFARVTRACSQRCLFRRTERPRLALGMRGFLAGVAQLDVQALPE